jgi:hypothetical protein
MVIDNGTHQKSIASFQNTGTTIDANDISINQTCWSVVNKDWVLIQWKVNNIKSPAVDITGFSITLELDISQVWADYGLGGDSGDDIDGYDAVNNVYWAQDDDGTTLGFGSAMVSAPVTHYFSRDYHPTTYDDYKALWENEDWLYGRLSAPNSVEGVIPGNRTSNIGWTGITIPAGSSRIFSLGIAINNTLDNMITALKDARYYYEELLLPAPPSAIQASLSGDGKDVMFSWNPSDDDGAGENDVKGYTVYKSSNGINGNYDFATWIPATGSPSYNWVDADAGDGDLNDYFYIIRASDTSNNEEQNENIFGKVVNKLKKGNNLISFPLSQVSTSKDHFLQTLGDNYRILQTYQAGESEPWFHWHRYKPAHLNDVIEMDPENGYYVEMLTSDYLVNIGEIPSAPQIPLKIGWNLVGYPSLTSYDRTSALNDLNFPEDVDAIWTYDATSQKWFEIGESDYLESGQGYLIHSRVENIWIVPI